MRPVPATWRGVFDPEELTMPRIFKGLALLVGALAALAVTDAAHAQKKTLVVALNQDPDILDPTLARTYVGRIIFSQMCEKLYEIDEGLRIHPQLAAAMPAITDGGRTVTIQLRSGVKFNDGTPMDAESVRFSLERHRTLKGSNRASELAPVEAIEVVDPLTIRLRLKAPFSPLLAQLTDRAGMPLSPTAVNKLGEKFGTAPVCVGPWQFAERVAQDRIVVEKSSHFFDPGQAKFDKIIFRIIVDDNVRLANLKSGDIDFMHQVSPTDATGIKREGRFELSNVTGLGYQGITINLRNKTGKTNPPGDLGTPLANDPRVREALELSIDREALNQVAYEGQNTVGCGPISPNSAFFDKTRKCPGRDVARAKKLLADAGLAGGYKFEMVIINNPPQRRVGEVIQGMQAPGVSDRLERPRRSRRQHPPDSDLQGKPEHVARLRREDRRAPEPGARGERRRPATRALSRGHRSLRRPAQHHLRLPSELHRRFPQEPQRVQGRARRPDPDQGHVLELTR